MTEQLPRSDTFDDLLPEIPLDHNELAYKNGALTAEAIGYTALSRDLLPKRECRHNDPTIRPGALSNSALQHQATERVKGS